MGISRDEALKWWPPAAVQDEPDCLGPGNRASGTEVRQETEEVPVAEAPAAVAEQPAAVQDEPDPGRRSNGAAVQQEIEEPAEEAPAATAEAPSAVQDDQDLVDKWYAEAWRPECLKAGLMPSREDDLKAAKRAFDFPSLWKRYAKPEKLLRQRSGAALDQGG